MRCEKCGLKMIALKRFYICEECEVRIPIEADIKPWYQVLAESPDFWCAETFVDFPHIIAHEYHRLQAMLAAGETYGCILQIKDTFEVLLKFPMTIILGGCEKKLRQLAEEATFNLEKIKEDYGSVHKIVETILSKPLSLGDWEAMADMARKLDAHKDLPQEGSQIYFKIVDMLKKIMQEFYFDGQRISNWRNSTIGHGALAFHDDDDFKEELADLLRVLKKALYVCSPYYHSLCLYSDDGFLLSGHDIAKQCLNAVKSFSIVLRETADYQKVELEPYLVQLASRAFLFDSYDSRKRYAHVLNYSHGKKTLYAELGQRLADLNKTLGNASIQNKTIYDPNLDEKDIHALEKLMHEKEIRKPAYMHDWLEDCLKTHDRGVFLLRAERGMGKTVFTNALDELDSCSYKNSENSLKGIMVRVWHFNSSYYSRIDIFKSGLVELLRTWVDRVERNGERVLSTNKFKGEIDEKCASFIENVLGGPEERKKATAELIGYIMNEYRRHGYRLEKLLIIFDGIDEVKNTAEINGSGFSEYAGKYQEKYGTVSVFDYIPDPALLPEGVYVLVTGRTKEEILENRGINDAIAKMNITEGLTLCRQHQSYQQTLYQYVRNDIFKMKDKQVGQVDHELIMGLLDKAELRFIYLNAYKKLYESGVDSTVNKQEKPLRIFLNSVKKLGDTYHKHVLKLLLLLNLTEESLTLRELAWLMGHETVSFRLMAVINDMRCFLECKRSYRGTLVLLSHEEWRKELSEGYPIEREEVVEELRQKFSQLYRHILTNTDTINLADELYDGESWLATYFSGVCGSKIVNFSEVIVALSKIANKFDVAGKPEYAIKRKILILDNYMNILPHVQKRDGTFFVNNLAIAYMNRGNALSQLGELEEAVEDYDRCVEIVEKLDRYEGMYDENSFASMYMNRGNALFRLMKLAQSIEDHNNCVRIRESLYKDGKLNDRNDLAYAYMNRGVALSKLLRLEEAVGDYNKCIHIMNSPDKDDTLCDRSILAGTYTNYGVALERLRRLEEAFEAYNQCAQILEELDKHNKLHDRNQLACSYMNRGSLLDKLGKLGEAIEDLNKCVQIREGLDRDGKLHDRNDLASAYFRRGATLDSVGKLEEAVEDYNRCVQIRNELNKVRELYDINDLVATYTNRGVTLENLGRLGDAIEDYSKSIQISEELNRGGKLYDKRSLVIAYMNRGYVFSQLGKLEEAVADYNEYIKMTDTLEEHDKIENKVSLVLVYMNRGNISFKIGKLYEAVEDYSKSIQLMEMLEEYEKLHNMNSLAQVYMNRGNVLNLLKRREESLSDYYESVLIMETLANERKPYDKKNLASGYMNLGILLFSLNDYENTLKYVLKSFPIFKVLVREQKSLEPNLVQSMYMAAYSAYKLGCMIDHYNEIVSCITAINPDHLGVASKKMLYQVVELIRNK